MAGVIKKKKKLFEANQEPSTLKDLEPREKRMSIVEADGGFIVSKDEYGGKKVVAKDLDELVKLVKKCFEADEDDKD